MQTVLISSKIRDGHGSDQALKVGEHGELFVTVHDHPPRDEGDFLIPIRQYFTDASGGNDMRVNGSLSSPVEFTIEADPDRDIYIKNVSIVIADAGAVLNEFGNINALDNGVVFEWNTQDLGETLIHEGLKSNFDFVRLCGGNPAFGNGSNAFKANNVVNNSEAFFCELDMTRVFGLGWGVKLRRGTLDKLRWIVRDDTRGVDGFDIVAYGSSF